MSQYETLERQKIHGYFHYRYKNGWWSLSSLQAESEITKKQLSSRINCIRNKQGEIYTLEQAVTMKAVPRKLNDYIIDTDLFYQVNKLMKPGSLAFTVR